MIFRQLYDAASGTYSYQYVELMNNLNLPNPKMMDVAVPANTKIGLSR